MIQLAGQVSFRVAAGFSDAESLTVPRNRLDTSVRDLLRDAFGRHTPIGRGSADPAARLEFGGRYFSPGDSVRAVLGLPEAGHEAAAEGGGPKEVDEVLRVMKSVVGGGRG